MPVNVIDRAAKQLGKSKKILEKLWDKAKKVAENVNKKDDYAYIMGIWKNMTGYKPKTASESNAIISAFEDFWLDDALEKDYDEPYVPFKNIIDRKSKKRFADEPKEVDEPDTFSGKGKLPIEKVLLLRYGYRHNMYGDEPDDINKATKTELLNSLKEKFGDKPFEFKATLDILPDFNHSQKIYVLLDQLIKDGKLEKIDKKYKVKAMLYKTEAFVKKFTRDNKINNITATRLKVIAKANFGTEITNAQEAESFLLNEVSASAFNNPNVCIRCGGAMEPCEIEGGVKAYYCPNDRVTLPRL